MAINLHMPFINSLMNHYCSSYERELIAAVYDIVSETINGRISIPIDCFDNFLKRTSIALCDHCRCVLLSISSTNFA